MVTAVLLGCSDIAVPDGFSPPPDSCNYFGSEYEIGDKFDSVDGCNQCSCGSDGFTVCTEMACACTGVVLPTCPPRCDGGFELAGEDCLPDEHCVISTVGDECACLDLTWACSVHPPLGQGCNQTCRE